MAPRFRRISTLVALAAAATVSAAHLDHYHPPADVAAAASEGRDPNSAATCGQCHTEFYQEWKGRAHSKAWVDELYQAQLKLRKKPQACYGCHIPVDVHARLGRKPKPRESLHDEGVTCVSCHKSRSTGDDILGPFGSKTDAHPCQKNPAFTSSVSMMCASCHGTKIGPVLPLARDHKTYRETLGEKAKSCVECHMPSIERHLAVSIVTGKPVGEKRMTRDHTILGPYDVEFCRQAFELGARADNGKDLVVSIRNGAGHRVPGLKLRQFVVAIAQLTKGGEQLATHEIVLSHENEIKVLEVREFRFDLADGANAIEVRIDHIFQDEVVATVLSEKIDL